MSLVQSAQSRQPEGTPAGGQFKKRQNKPPEGTLAESATGSFAFPPRAFESVAQYVEFFETAPISDRVLSNADHAYRQWRQDEINAEVRAAYAVYGNDPQVLAQARKNVVTSDRKAQEFIARARAEAEARRPQASIEPHRMRNILRAHQLWYYSSTLETDADRAQVLSHHLAGQQWTVQEIVDGNSTPGWASRAMTDSDLAAVDAMERVARSLDERDMI